MKQSVKQLIKSHKILVKLGKLCYHADVNGKAQHSIGFRLIPKHK